MKKFFTLVLLCFAVLAVSARSQETVPTYQEFENHNHRVGLYASMMSGYGMCYQYHFENNWAIKGQMFGFGSLNKDDGYSDYYDGLIFSIGADVQYSLQRTTVTRTYFMFGGSFGYNEEDTYSYPDHKYDIRRSLNFGIGLGAEFRIWNHINVAIEGGYYVNKEHNSIVNSRYNNITKQYEEFYVTKKPIHIGLGAGIGLYYSF